MAAASGMTCVNEGRPIPLAEDAEFEDDAPPMRPRRLRRARRIAGASVLVLALATGGLWLARKPIADSFIARQLAGYGITASYEVTRIGPRTQRIEHLVIGDPRRPDLTVRLLEVDIGLGFSGARITRVKAQGVRLRGALADGRLTLGQIDRLLDGGTGEAQLPEWVADIADARAAIATPYGAVDIGFAGRGYVPSGFSGRVQASAAGLRVGDCVLDGLAAPLAMSTADQQLVFDGPVKTRGLRCSEAGLTLPRPVLDLNVRSDLALSRISGAASFAAPGLEQAGRRFGRLAGLLTMQGSHDDLRGSTSLSADSMRLDGVETGMAKLRGNFALRPQARDRAIAITGVATVDDMRSAGGIDLAAVKDAAAGTPVAPLVDRLVRAVGQAEAANHMVVGGAVNLLGAHGNATLDQLEFTSASGARIIAARGSTIRAKWPDGGAVQAEGALLLSGGDLPEGRIAFASHEDGRLTGTATLAPYQAGTARLALTPVQFAVAGDGTGRISTAITLDGPLPDGALEGLSVPIAAQLGADGSVRMIGDCAPVRWRALRMSSMALDPAELRLCGIGRGDFQLGAVRLTGRAGDSPLLLTASGAHYALKNGAFSLADPDVRIGAGPDPVRMAASRLSGAALGPGRIGGTIENGVGRIGTVPLDLTDVAGNWTFADSRLTLDGALMVSDTQPDPRFNPLAGREVHLTLVNGRIEATGALVHPKRDAKVATVAIRHDLSSGEGRADLTVDGLTFGQAVQPDDLTPLALGVVANVQGRVEGAGHIGWTGTQVTSDGQFSTQDMNLAAAFGPVEGLSTTIRFADLLGMRTEPGQIVTLRDVNPGIEVHDGVIRYALLSNEQARIEGGHWPFAGGDLELLPATLDLDSRKPRAFTFRVVGLDAGAFINTLELDNISATGTFDGLLPMIFDERGGRIEGGVLIARQQGDAPRILETTQGLSVPCDPQRQAGNLSYVGDVSNAEMNMFGKLAFEVLKNLRYRCLAIFLDGALDGEFVTRVSVNGVNQGTDEARASFITRPFVGLPFLFNVRIEAPFRGLLNTAAGLADPTLLIRASDLNGQNANGQNVNEATDGLAVQPSDSENDAERGQE